MSRRLVIFGLRRGRFVNPLGAPGSFIRRTPGSDAQVPLQSHSVVSQKSDSFGVCECGCRGWGEPFAEVAEFDESSGAEVVGEAGFEPVFGSFTVAEATR